MLLRPLVRIYGFQPHTLTSWGSAIGAMLAARRTTRPLAGWILIAIGFGGAGVAWERATASDLRKILGCEWQEPMKCFLRHSPQAIAGMYLLGRR